MFPLRDDNPTVSTSVATFAIIGLNIAAWLLVEGAGSSASVAKAVCQLGAIPGELLGTVHAGTQVPLGPGQVCTLGSKPAWYTLITHMFMHGGWFHIIGNLWFLWVFGDNVEDAMGPLRFVVFYLLCGLAAVGSQILSSPDSAIPMVGASGAIGGIMGAYARLYPRAPVHMLLWLFFYVDRIIVPAYLLLGYWFLVQVLSGIPSLSAQGGGVAFWAHVGGFSTGLLLVGLFSSSERLEAHRQLLEARSSRLWRMRGGF